MTRTTPGMPCWSRPSTTMNSLPSAKPWACAHASRNRLTWIDLVPYDRRLIVIHLTFTFHGYSHDCQPVQLLHQKDNPDRTAKADATAGIDGFQIRGQKLCRRQIQGGRRLDQWRAG